MSNQANNNLKIEFTNIDNLNHDFSSLLKKNYVYENDEALEILNTIKIYDKSLNLTDKTNLEFSKETLGFKLSSNDKTYDLNVKLGENNFENGIEHLIKIGSNKLDKDKDIINDKKLNSIFNKDFNFSIKDEHIDKIKNIFAKTFDSIGHISGDEVTSNFINGFKKSFPKSQENNLSKDNSIGKDFLDFKKKANDKNKDNEKVITKHKSSLGLG